MKELKEIYNKREVFSNITYSIDMLRLKTYIDYNHYNNIDFYLRTYCKDKIKKFYISDRPQCFRYNWNIEVEEGSFWFGFCHNSEEKLPERLEPQYNFTIEFNPNKLKNNNILMHLLGQSGLWRIIKYDLAMDLKVNILDLIIDKSGKRNIHVFGTGYDDRTYELGTVGSGKIKIYNKKKESNLKITGSLTRIELTREIKDFSIGDIVYFNYDCKFPDIYLNNYVYSLSDYDCKDRTLYALLYAVQNGYPINDLTRVYKQKLKNLLAGGYKIKFDTKTANQVLKQTIYYYFMQNPLVIFK